MLRALRDWGCDTYAQPTWLDVPIPADLMPIFGKHLRAPFDLIINHWSPDALEIAEATRRACRIAVAWTMWEFTSMQPHLRNRSTLKKRLKFYDLVLGYDPVTMQALAPYLTKGQSSGVLQGGYDSRNWKPMERDWFGTDFGFAMHGALNNRKQPMMVLQAHLELRAEHEDYRNQARMSFHTHIGPLFPELNQILNTPDDQRVRVFYEAWDDATLKDFYQANHCLIYPSRGEGKNVPALEFLTTGGTVAVTNWGGHTMWLRDDIAYPMDYTLGPTIGRFPDKAQDAKVDLAEIKSTMLHIFRNRSEAKAKGELGARLIPQMCDWDVVVEALFRRINDLCPHPGPLVYEMAQEAHRNRQQAGPR